MPSTFQHKEGSGSLFRNHRKQEGSKQPDYTGEAMIDGELRQISAWVREGKKGKFFSFQFKRKDSQAPRKEPPAQVTPEAQAELDDETQIPF